MTNHDTWTCNFGNTMVIKLLGSTQEFTKFNAFGYHTTIRVTLTIVERAEIESEVSLLFSFGICIYSVLSWLWHWNSKTDLHVVWNRKRDFLVGKKTLFSDWGKKKEEMETEFLKRALKEVWFWVSFNFLSTQPPLRSSFSPWCVSLTGVENGFHSKESFPLFFPFHPSDSDYHL